VGGTRVKKVAGPTQRRFEIVHRDSLV
jgi:hypothetical protein